jgi:hypothetical protein
MLGLFLELTVSANLLTWAGIPYVTDGGTLAAKLHPGTDMLCLAAGVLVGGRGGWARLTADRPLACFLGGLLACLVYLQVMTGTGHLVVLLDSFLPAGLLALVLHHATPSQLRHLRRMMQVLIGAAALLALVETACQATLFPLYLNDAAYHPHAEDFRPISFYDHPLTGAVMTLLGLALRPACGWPRFLYAALMWAALLAFGGRMALGVAVLMAFVAGAVRLAGLVLRRDPAAARMIAGTGVVVLLGALCACLALAGGLGTRLAGHLYWDDSAQVRLAQWQLLGQMDTWQILFGTRRDELLSLLTPLWLGPGVEVIENFWLLMFAALGVFGFPLFVGSLAALLVWCWRRSALQGRLLLLGVLLVSSGSNSLGRKSTILVCLVAAIACLPTGSRRAAYAPGDAPNLGTAQLRRAAA